MRRDQSKRRRPHGAELRTQVLTACLAPGATVAAVAAEHGLSPSLVYGWRQAEREKTMRPHGLKLAPQRPSFVELPLSQRNATAKPIAQSEIRIELRQGSTTVNVQWPSEAASHCAVWLRDLLQ